MGTVHPKPELCEDGLNPEKSPALTDSSSIFSSWLALLSVSIGAFALVTSEFLPVGILNEVSRDLNISVGHAGLMITLPGILAALAAPLLTVGVGNLDRRKLLIFLTLVMIIANGIVALSNTFSMVLAGRLLLGMAIGGFWATAIALSARLAPKGVSVAQSTSIIMAGVTLATVLGVPFGTWLSNLYGWRVTFAVTALLGIVVLVVQLLMLPRLNPTQVIRVKDLPALFLNAKARVGLIAVLFIGLAHFAAYTYVAPFFKNISHFSPSLISTLLLVYGAAGVMGNFFAGVAASKNIRTTFLVVALLLGLSMALFPLLATSLMGASILIAVWGFAFGAFPACANIWMFAAAPEAVEKGMPLFVGMFQVMIALGSFAGGQVVDHFGIPVILWLATASIVMGGLWLLLFGRGVSSASLNHTVSSH